MNLRVTQVSFHPQVGRSKGPKMQHMETLIKNFAVCSGKDVNKRRKEESLS